MLGDALSYPRRGDGWLKRIGIGGLLSLGSFLVIPAIFLQGYLVRVLRSAAMDEETPPAFDDWGEMLVDGLKLYVVSLAYLIVPYAVFIAAFFSISGQGGGSTIGAIVLLVASIALLLVAYVLPVALTNFALHDSIGAAFDFGTVFGAAFSGRYFLAVVLAAVVGGVLNIVGTFLIILLLVGFFVLFYVQVFAFYLVGSGCGPKLVDGGESAEQSATDAVEY